jgi:ATP-dependent helicase/DNAse subunit B
MPTQIILAPVGAGKTEAALRQLVETLDEQPLARVWALLPSKRQEEAFRSRLVEWTDNRRVYFNVEFFNFYDLYRRLLDMAGRPPRHVMEGARHGLLRQALAHLVQSGQLPLYGAIAHKSGFARVMAAFIRELKQNRVYPDDYAQAALTQKDHDLARIYAAYQDRLIDYHLVDDEGEGWLAVDALTADASLASDLALLIVDGFDQFSPVQADLLALLADRALETTITLTTVPGREATAGRRFQQTRERLRERFYAVSEITPDTPPDDRHADLTHLIDRVFHPEPRSRASVGGITLLEAPDPAAETAAMLRHVKQCLLDGVPPDQILIALRDWNRYYPHFIAHGAAYQLPLALHYGVPLAENPAVVALIHLLDLHTYHFRRRDLLDAVRSPYFDLPGLIGQRVDWLDRISQAFIVTGERDQWLEAIPQASHMPPADEDDQEPAAPLLTAEDADELLGDLRDFFAGVTPPAQGTMRAYVTWLEGLIGRDPVAALDDALDFEGDPLPTEGSAAYTVSLIERVRAGDAPENIVARDLAAMQAVKRVLRGLLSTADLIASLDNRETVLDWATFYADFLSALGTTLIESRPDRAGRVLVTTAADARGLPHEVVGIVGLSEGLFPTQLAEDPLYLDSERLDLTARGVTLATRAERAADDGLFYELICLPRRALILSRPTMQDGKPWLPSHLWKAVGTVFTDSGHEPMLRRVGLARTLPVEEAATVEEVMLGVASALNEPLNHLTPAAVGAYNWLAGQDIWTHVLRSRNIEASRLSLEPHDRYSGRIKDSALRALISDLLGEGRVWSASQFNDYAVCGFRFFARRLLRLEAYKEPEEGMDAAQRGTVNHAILEAAYTRFMRDGLVIAPENVEAAIVTLREVADPILADAPRRFGFRAGPTWERERSVLLRRLEALVQADFEDDPLDKLLPGVRRPVALEAAFGPSEYHEVALIDFGPAGRLRLRGYIDRIDRVGDQAVVIDYKSGVSPRLADMAEGRNFQMAAYLLAAQSILDRVGRPLRVAGGAFWNIHKNKIENVTSLDDKGEEALGSAAHHLAAHIARGRRGDFAAQASKPEDGKCSRHCEFSQLCRAAVTHRRKREG